MRRCREREDELCRALGDGMCVRSVRASAEHRTLQARPLGSETRRVCVTNAARACSDVGNARGELHGALRDLKREGRSLLNSLGSKSVVT